MGSVFQPVGIIRENAEVGRVLGLHLRMMVAERNGGLEGIAGERFCEKNGISGEDLEGYKELRKRRVEELIEDGARVGVMTLIELAASARNPRMRAKCSVELLNRAGYVKPEFGARVSIEARGGGEVIKHLLPEADRAKVVKFLRDSVPKEVLRDSIPSEAKDNTLSETKGSRLQEAGGEVKREVVDSVSAGGRNEDG